MGSLSDYINVNTLFIAVIVLTIVILIMLITYFTSIRPGLNKSSSIKSADNSSLDSVFSQITRNEEEELLNDYELVAVITAAIYASLGDEVPSDGLVVRSIKRVNSRKRINS